jgi:hypothetical protein
LLVEFVKIQNVAVLTQDTAHIVPAYNEVLIQVIMMGGKFVYGKSHSGGEKMKLRLW